MTFENSYGSSDESATARRDTAGNRSYYSPLRIMNSDGIRGFNFEFRSGLLQFKISSKTDNGWNKDPDAVIYLSPTKAALLVKEIHAMIDYISEGKVDNKRAFGVSGGMNEKISFIAFQPKDNGIITVNIGKFDNAGQIVEKHSCDLNMKYNYSLEWKDLDAMDLEKVYDDSIEINQIIQVLTDFSRFMNGAAAYGIAYTTRYDTQRILNKLDPIYDKLGIERLQGTGSYSRGSNDFLNNASGSSKAGDFDALFS